MPRTKRAEQQAAPANDAGDSTELLPTKDPCGTCDRPLAQATGTVAPQSLPAPPRPAGTTFKLNDLRLNGVKALSNEELQSITAPYIGRDVTLGDLEGLAQAITARYKERGYFLAQAIVPVQTVRDGIVEISVIEGRLGKVDVVVAPDAPLARRACAASSRRCSRARRSARRATSARCCCCRTSPA
jgi:hemolysin activation/secretion protein